LEFYREDITFSIQNKTFFVEGEYYFRNSSDQVIERILFYPFPERKDLADVDSVKIYNLSENKIIPITKKNNAGVFFSIIVPAEDSLIVEVKYRQDMNSGRAEYILTSTKNWDQALELAQFKLIIPLEIDLKSVSYNIESFNLGKEEMTYYWRKENFYPSKNFIVTVIQH